MAKPYWFKQSDGFVRDGNRLHREEIKSINAQLAVPAGPPGFAESQPHQDVIALMVPRSPESRRPCRGFTILERLQSSPEIQRKMTEIALKNIIPDRWGVHYTDGYNEQIRNRRMDLLQTLGEAALEAPAA